MAMRRHLLRQGIAVALIGLAVVASSGCGYLKNLRDDAMDCIIVGAGVVPAVVQSKGQTRAVGFLPPCIGAYIQVTDFMHLGALFKITGDVEIDRRGAGALVDYRTKIGFGPLHYIVVKQQPVWVNAYKCEGNQMDGWRKHMRELKDPVFKAPAKELIFQNSRPRPFLHRGWQDWEVVCLELAVPEPFICHKGCTVRLGFDLSQVLDLVTSVIGVDYYDDNAYKFWGGLRFPPVEEQQPKK